MIQPYFCANLKVTDEFYQSVFEQEGADEAERLVNGATGAINQELAKYTKMDIALNRDSYLKPMPGGGMAFEELDGAEVVVYPESPSGRELKPIKNNFTKDEGESWEDFFRGLIQFCKEIGAKYKIQ